MHGAVIGVMRQLSGLWFDSNGKTQNCKNPWYIGSLNVIGVIDSQLVYIKPPPPPNATRLPRSVTQRAYWKASEWQKFLLYYGLVVLKDILPVRFYKHFLLLNESLFVLNQCNINQTDLYDTRKKIEAFVSNFQTFY